MKQMKLLAGTLGVAAALAAQSAFGAGFGIYEGSARGNAMGTEVTADPASPSVLYNNAAGMTELEGTQFEAGATFIRPSQTVQTTTPAGTSAQAQADVAASSILELSAQSPNGSLCTRAWIGARAIATGVVSATVAAVNVAIPAGKRRNR